MNQPPHLDYPALYASRKDRDSNLKGVTSGLYYLFGEHGEVLYVGQAGFVEGRISSHRCKGKIPFTHYTIYRTSEKWKYEIEAIDKFRPKYNHHHNPDKRKAARAIPPMIHDTFPI